MEKVRNLNIVKRAGALVMAGVTLVSLSACSKNHKKDSFLDGSLLEKAVVANVDGNYEIVRKETPIRCFDLDGYRDGSFLNFVTKQDHNHYYNVITGEWLTDGPVCDMIFIKDKEHTTDNYSYHSTRKVEEVNVLGSIDSYMYYNKYYVIDKRESEVKDYE